MKLKIIFLFLTPFLLFFKSYGGNEKYEVKLLLSPSFETLNPRNRAFKQDVKWGYKLSYNFGMEYMRYFAPDVSMTFGLLLQNKGYRTILEDLNATDPVYKNTFFTLSTKFISVPINLNIHLPTGKKSAIILSAGLVMGRLIDARSIQKRISDDDLKKVIILKKDVGIDTKTITRAGYYNKWFLGANIGIAYTKYIKDKMVFTVQPSYTVQMNRAYDKNANINFGNQYIIRPKFDSFALELKIGYYFNKQIKNMQKDF